MTKTLIYKMDFKCKSNEFSCITSYAYVIMFYMLPHYNNEQKDISV